MEAFDFLFVVPVTTAVETPTGLDFQAVDAMAVDLVVTVATVGGSETTAGAADIFVEVVLAVDLMVEVVTVAGVVAATGVASTSRTAADDATDAPLAPWLKFAAKSLKSAALTRPS